MYSPHLTPTNSTCQPQVRWWIVHCAQSSPAHLATLWDYVAWRLIYKFHMLCFNWIQSQQARLFRKLEKLKEDIFQRLHEKAQSQTWQLGTKKTFEALLCSVCSADGFLRPVLTERHRNDSAALCVSKCLGRISFCTSKASFARPEHKENHWKSLWNCRNMGVKKCKWQSLLISENSILTNMNPENHNLLPAFTSCILANSNLEDGKIHRWLWPSRVRASQHSSGHP